MLDQLRRWLARWPADRVSRLSLAKRLAAAQDFGSGITLYKTIHTGTPVVTLEGRSLRSRYVAAAYRLMEVEDPPVAASPEAYVELAAALMQDPQRREFLRQEIAAKAKTRLYDRLDYVRGFEDFALKAVAQARCDQGRGG